jgi:DNA-directed RNA polymerase specialized sigma24 family protein
VVGRPYVIDLLSLTKTARIARALATLPKAQHEVLLAHFVEGLSLRQLNPAVSKQANHERVKRASRALLRALMAQADEPIVLRMEDF